ncbi:MAG: hypothetical protein ACJ8F7_04790, partial [Gemmataceae bacterium]
AVAVVIALLSARPYAGGWNDGTRLATVEALVDYHTFAIEDSVFVKVPADGRTYPASDSILQRTGTYDKLLIDGHYYTDKPPVPAVLLAGVYWAVQRVTSLSARDDTAIYCWLLTVCQSGLAFVVTVLSWRHIARLVGLADGPALGLTALFALATVAVCYTRVVNTHIVLLAVASLMLVTMLRWQRLAAPWSTVMNAESAGEEPLPLPSPKRGGATTADCETRQRHFAASATPLSFNDDRPSPLRGGEGEGSRPRRLQRLSNSWLLSLLWLGFLGGFAYTTDYGAGPMVFGGLGLWVLLRCWQLPDWPRRIAGCVAFGVAALPWLLAHHGINYAIGGMFAPLNTNPAYFRYPDCPFTPESLSGGWRHPGPVAFILYAVDMLVGQRGFLGNNLMLYLAVCGLPVLLRRRLAERPELVCGLVWAAAIVLGFSASSNNYAGNCVSIRWFLPLLAPGFLTLAVLLREFPKYRTDCWILAGWTLPWVWLNWVTGPWWRAPVAAYWVLMSWGLTHWALYSLWRWGVPQRLILAKRNWRLGAGFLRQP